MRDGVSRVSEVAAPASVKVALLWRMELSPRTIIVRNAAWCPIYSIRWSQLILCAVTSSGTRQSRHADLVPPRRDGMRLMT